MFNALVIIGEIVWVDLVNAGFVNLDDVGHKRRDLSELLRSVFGNGILLEHSVMQLLNAYPSEESVTGLLNYFSPKK